MNSRRQIHIFNAIDILTGSFWTIGATQIAQASSILPHGNLASGEVIDNDVFTTGENVVIDEPSRVMRYPWQPGTNQCTVNAVVCYRATGDHPGRSGRDTYVGALSLELGPGGFAAQPLLYWGLSYNSGWLCHPARLKHSLPECRPPGRYLQDTRAIIGILKLVEVSLIDWEVSLSPLSDLQPGMAAAPRALGAWSPHYLLDPFRNLSLLAASIQLNCCPA